MSSVPIGPWPAGIDMVSELTELAEGAVVDAVNGVLVKGGVFVRREGEELVLADDMHSLWSYGGVTYAMRGATLGTTDLVSGTPTFTPIGDLSSPLPVSYDVLNNEIVLSNTFGMYRLVGGEIVPFGVEMPGAFAVIPQEAGGLQAGRYGVAISYVSHTGEEGGLSPATFANIEAGQGMWISLPTPIEDATGSINIYCTDPGGAELRFAANILAGVWGTTIADDTKRGELADNKFLARLPYGRFISVWQGRLLSARGHTLYWSEPMRYGLYNPVNNFVQFENEIGFIGTTPTGIFVGTLDGVYFLAGTSPAEWKLSKVDLETPMLGGCLRVSVEAFNREEELFPAGTDYVIAWLGAGGFHFGLPSGDVVRPQNDRINLDLLGTTGTIQLVGDVLTAILF